MQAVREDNLAAVRDAIQASPDLARHPRVVVAAGGRALQPALVLLKKAGADLNAVWRNYRPLHNLLQEDAHAVAGKPSPARIACLEWLLANGADPELPGAWPSSRAILVAAFVGSHDYIKVLRSGGAKVDGFAAAALGDRNLVEKDLRRNPAFVRARDIGGLTALQCAAGSRLPKADTLAAAQLLIDAGAEVGALTRSWSEDVNAVYFAARRKDLTMFELLLDSGADPTDALAHAVWGKAFDLAEAALRHGAVVDCAVANGKPLLNDVIRWGQIPQTMWLLAHGASPNVPDERGWTAVHQAASRGNARMLRAVLQAGGDATRLDREGRTPRGLS